ncbi:epoxyqueuosine reductase [Chitinophaga terrae (ex Kim and Jung 2007)]|jgi:epoxyqueuosine reductase|uniref:Epoxyqueuosine reductase n=1 Tax=Chitinophaga terrae (ex Kim and Jung 2007) TaxID=408074 RepID=A0A1H3YXE4_9BACT|nr:tRNA epoxyqueuosine(34) reductase QueG [Chitinophaga terrae (ex Kim and Jung 2007)]MDQ0107285.1 epoxyqueuosine reductase [Chitinophaga terrae (ex Kim and Jung 2007)]GEP88559.1 epoxyqueuosine reductase [Chitinophaga terrae (ex Kim and Jung 2007)]SEA16215.1 epoxyqueuosine reductase [Chitinophaga terrae (ex Kim and Jung 2007)]
MNATVYIKQLAAQLGFDYCGIAAAVQLDDDARRLESWLNKGMHGNMQYMENHFDKRIDPRKLVDGAKSVITLLFNYYPGERQREDAPQVSKYAYGEDYHEVIRARLKTMLARMQEQFGQVQGRGFVDSAPVLERAWAQRSGLGWIGKNGNLIHKQAGSFFFIATLITDLELEYDGPVADFCGTCRRCLDACPTSAIVAPGVVDGSRCISYFTIELKEQLIPEQMQGKFDNWFFGCDTCQDVCPWNRFSKAHNEAAFTPLPEILNFSTSDWEEMTEETFKEVFRRSPLKRSKYAGIRRNLRFWKMNRGS